MNKPNVFTDFHHAGLLNSLIMLFEGRLGGAVYRPIGMEWAEKGYWKVYDHPATQQQFLGIGANTPDNTPPLNELVKIGHVEGMPIYQCKDIEGDTTNKAITFDAFMDLPIDIVIASIPAHVEPFKRLCELHPNKPKLIFQIGNAWTIEAAQAPNIMASAIIHDVPANINFISYHQEFDTQLKFIYHPPHIYKETPDTIYTNDAWPADMCRYCHENNKRQISSFVNCFDSQGNYADDWQLFTRIERTMPAWIFKSFGGQCRDGSKNGGYELSQAMMDARFIWHTKAGGDGYGHVIHNAAAVGRPLIVKKEYYAGKMADKLLLDGYTCIAIDNLSIDDIVGKIQHYNEPERYAQMCEAAYTNFKNVCDFDKEFENIKSFLDNLQ